MRINDFRFRISDSWLKKHICEPNLERVLEAFLLRERIDAPLRQAYLGTRWIGPAQTQLDPCRISTKADETKEEDK